MLEKSGFLGELSFATIGAQGSGPIDPFGTWENTVAQVEAEVANDYYTFGIVEYG